MARSHGATCALRFTSTRTGSVLMNRPIIDSIPGSEVGRPEDVAPNTTWRVRL
jgi:hypothetical protein